MHTEDLKTQRLHYRLSHRRSLCGGGASTTTTTAAVVTTTTTIATKTNTTTTVHYYHYNLHHFAGVERCLNQIRSLTRIHWLSYNTNSRRHHVICSSFINVFALRPDIWFGEKFSWWEQTTFRWASKLEEGRSFDIVLGRFISDDLFGNIYIWWWCRPLFSSSVISSRCPDTRGKAWIHLASPSPSHQCNNVFVFNILTFIIISTLIMIFIWRTKILGKHHISLYETYFLCHILRPSGSYIYGQNSCRTRNCSRWKVGFLGTFCCCIFPRICVLRLRGRECSDIRWGPRGAVVPPHLCICITAPHYFSFPNINICVQISPLPGSELLMGLWTPLKCILAASPPPGHTLLL